MVWHNVRAEGLLVARPGRLVYPRAQPPGPSLDWRRQEANKHRAISFYLPRFSHRYIQTQHSDLIRREWRPGAVTQPVSQLYCSLVSLKELFGRLLPYCKCIVSCCRISGRTNPVVVHMICIANVSTFTYLSSSFLSFNTESFAVITQWRSNTVQYYFNTCLFVCIISTSSLIPSIYISILSVQNSVKNVKV